MTLASSNDSHIVVGGPCSASASQVKPAGQSASELHRMSMVIRSALSSCGASQAPTNAIPSPARPEATTTHNEMAWWVLVMVSSRGSRRRWIITTGPPPQPSSFDGLLGRLLHDAIHLY